MGTKSDVSVRSQSSQSIRIDHDPRPEESDTGRRKAVTGVSAPAQRSKRRDKNDSPAEVWKIRAALLKVALQICAPYCRDPSGPVAM